MSEQRGSEGSYWDLEQAAWVRYPVEPQVHVPEQGGAAAGRPHEATAASEASDVGRSGCGSDAHRLGPGGRGAAADRLATRG